jgi:hypothetical protein
METSVNPRARLLHLIDAAAEIAGSDNKLAQQIEATRFQISQWRAGSRPCPLEAQVLMAGIAGFNAAEVLSYALIERNRDTPRGEKLFTALGKATAARGAAGLLLLSGSAGSAFDYLIRCIDKLNRLRYSY